MAVSKLNPVSGGKTRRLITLTSGTSWTVPATVTFVNVTLRGGGGGGGGANGQGTFGTFGAGGDSVSSTLTTTPAASITYAIGAGGTAGTYLGVVGGTGGTTTFTGATSATGGQGGLTGGGNEFKPGAGRINAQANGGAGAYRPSSGGSIPWDGGTGGTGSIDIEYWV
jgi:hypothetical protein